MCENVQVVPAMWVKVFNVFRVNKDLRLGDYYMPQRYGKMIKISKMDVLKIKGFAHGIASTRLYEGRLRAPTCAKRLVGVAHRLAPAELIHGRHDTSCSCKWVLIFRMLLSPVPFCTSLK